MEENKIRCVECGDYKDSMSNCPKCGYYVCDWCMSGHINQYHGNSRDEREKEDDRW